MKKHAPLEPNPTPEANGDMPQRKREGPESGLVTQKPMYPDVDEYYESMDWGGRSRHFERDPDAKSRW